MIVLNYVLAIIPLLSQFCLAASAPEAVPNQYLAMLTEGMDSELFDTTLGLVRDALGENNELRQTWNFFDFRGFSFSAPSAVVDIIRAIPGVQVVHPNYSHHKLQQNKNPFVNSHVDPTLYALDRISHRANINRSPPGTRPYYAFNLPAGQYTRVYMVDSGVRTSHGDFGGRAVKGRNFAPANVLNGNPPNAFEDFYDHGTPGAGLAIGTNYGAAPRAFLTDVRIFNDNGSTTYEAEISGIDWSANDAVNAGIVRTSVINMSFGGVDTGDADILKYSVRSAIRNGLFVSIAAGNDRMDVAEFVPANVAEGCTIGGSDADDKEYYYSNYGRFIDLWAPATGYLAPSSASDTATKLVYGTSFAAPLAAGVAVLFKSFGPDIYNGYSAQGTCTLLKNLGTKNVLNLSAFPDDNPGPNILLYNNSTR